MQKTKRRAHAQHSQYDVSDDLARIKALIGETAIDVKGRAGEVLSQSYENAKGKTIDFKDNIENYTQTKPFTSLSMSFLTGLLIGWIVNKL